MNMEMALIGKIQKHGFRGSLRIVQNILCKPIRPVVYALLRILPIDDNLIVFESEPDCCDNAWALYQYLKPKEKYHFVWVVVNPTLYSRLNDTRFISRSGSGPRLRAYFYYARAKYNVFTHCSLPEFVKRGSQVAIYTSHGCPIKASKGSGTLAFDYTLTLGENAIKPQALILNCDEVKVIPLGLPRNDMLLANISTGISNPFATGQNEKVLLWMPTFRKSVHDSLSEMGCDTETGLPLFASEESLEELNSFLLNNKAEVIIKIHHLQADKPVFRKHFSNIVFVTDDDLSSKGIQLYEMVGKSDALITDYSSISLDYLLVDKPVCYILDDMESYKADRGFVWDNILEIMPGNHVFEQRQLYDFLVEVVGEEDRFSMQRAKVKEFIYGEKSDGGSCERFEKYFLE